MMLRAKQKGFTLLELLVVITLLAILSVGALVAYDGIGENAQAAAGANNTAAVDRAIRTYKAVSLAYPDQWDNLASTAAVGQPFDTTLVHNKTQLGFGGWTIPAASGVGTYRNKMLDGFAELGIKTVQQVPGIAAGAEATPNLVHNEGGNASATEVDMIDAAFGNVAIVPSVNVTGANGTGGTACTANGTSISTPYATTNAATGATVWVANDNGLGRRLNAIHDSLEDDECQLVVALGFGHDAAHSTAGSAAAIATAPTYTSKDINPSTHYGRYFALFHFGTDEDGDNDVELDELKDKPVLIAVVDGEGNAIDKNIANANKQN